MASDPICLLVLIGLGIHEFSLSAPCLPRLKRFINQIDTTVAKELANKILLEADSTVIRKILETAIEGFPGTEH